MQQSNLIFAYLFGAYLIFVTMRGELPLYMGFLLSSAPGTYAPPTASTAPVGASSGGASGGAAASGGAPAASGSSSPFDMANQLMGAVGGVMGGGGDPFASTPAPGGSTGKAGGATNTNWIGYAKTAASFLMFL